MKILLKNLPKYRIEKLVICSIEQALYQALAVIDGEERLVWESDKQCFRSRNLMEFRESFEHLDIPEIVLRHDSVYDEMIGLSEGISNNRLEVPLDQNPYSFSKP